MAALKLLNLLALVAILALSSLTLPVNALVADRAQVARHVRGHHTFAKRKRSDTTSTTGLCKPRPSSAAVYAPSSTPAPPPAPTSSSSVAAAAPSPTPSSSGNTGKKWGLAWGADPALLKNFDLPNVGFIYNWSPQKVQGADALGLEFLPMLWGWNQITSFQQVVVEGYANYALGVNEPDQPSQANMSPQDAFNMWMQYINPLKDKGYHLVSPACTDSENSLTWYQQFFALCDQTSGCQVDSIAFHAYTTDPQWTQSYAAWLNGNYSRPVMITEFAAQNFANLNDEPDMAAVWSYAYAISDFVNKTPWLIAAFPFGIMDNLQGVDTNNALLGSDGQPTSLAYFYFG